MSSFEFIVSNPEHLPLTQRGDPLTDTERWVLKRIAMMVVGTTEFYEQTDGYRWMLGTTNDWWMDRRRAGAFLLAYRYGGGGNAEFMLKLRDVIWWLFGTETASAKLADTLDHAEQHRASHET